MKLYGIIIIGLLVGCGDLNVNGDPSVAVNTQGAKAVPAKTEPAPAGTTTQPAPATAKAPLQAAQSKWTAQEFTRNMPGCEEESIAASQRNWPVPMDSTEATQFCSCFINAISNVYDFATYKANYDRIVDEPGIKTQSQACVDQIKTERDKAQAASCQFGKICKGQDKDAVLAVLGHPTSIIDTSIGGQTWVYTEDPTASEVCANMSGGTYQYLQCSVTFNKAGTLVSQSTIKPEKLDISNW